jgi:hypothetical protein
LLVVAVTKNPPKTQRATDCRLRAWRSAGLHQPSWVRSHLATVHRALVLRKFGTLVAADLRAVEDCLRVAVGL